MVIHGSGMRKVNFSCMPDFMDVMSMTSALINMWMGNIGPPEVRTGELWWMARYRKRPSEMACGILLFGLMDITLRRIRRGGEEELYQRYDFKGVLGGVYDHNREL